MLMRFLPYRWRTPIASARHDRVAAAILDTAPIVPARDGVVLFSMMGTKVLLPYLVAVKSLWASLRRGRIVILDDGSLTEADKAVLAHHCGDPEIIPIASVETGAFPRGGCWERFLTILDRGGDEYWIQLDSDTVTTGPVPEVVAAIEANRSFTLLGGTEAEVGALPLAEIAREHYPEGPFEGHVQGRFESRLDAIEAASDMKYVRGCAGFAGFAAGCAGRERAHRCLALLEEILGPEDAALWGTEQIASNFHIANEPDSVMLPSARYINYWGEKWNEVPPFVHFVGPFRHANQAYATATRQAISRLRPASPAPRQAQA